MKVKNILSEEQTAAAEWLAKNNGLLLATPGSGKTRTALSMLEMTGERALILAPASVTERTWQDEQKTTELGRRIVAYRGTPKARKRTLDQAGDAHIVCSYELAPELTAKAAGLFDAIVFDEVTRVRNPRGKRYQHIRNNTRGIKHRVGLTGTPCANHYHQLYGQLQQTAGLPMIYQQWLDRFFIRKIMQRTRYNLRPRAYYVDGSNSYELIKPLLEPRVHRMAAGHQGELRTIDHWVSVPEKAHIEVTFDNLIKAQQMAQGQVYVPMPDSPDGLAFVHNVKRDTLADLLEALQGEPALIFYAFRHDIGRIRDAAKTANVNRIEVPDTPRELGALLDDWNAKKIEALVVHPASAGHGLNLQQGSRTVIWYGLPTDAELYEQGLRRVHRQGQTQMVLNHRILARCPMDALLVRLLKQKHGKASELLREEYGKKLKTA